MEENSALIIDSSSRSIDFMIEEKKVSFMGVERGALKLFRNNVRMLATIGDFDSIDSVELKKLKAYTNVIKLPSEKKLSDMEEAIILAKSYGFKKIYIIADIARLDQLLVNIELVNKYSITMFTNGATILKVNSKYKEVNIRKNNYKYISFFPLTQTVDIQTNAALEYTLPRRLKKDDTSIYVSNEIKGPEVIVKVTSGEVLVVQASDPKFTNRKLL